MKGIRSKKDITGMSDFNSWASFEEEAAITWKNACHYNEDGSEIYEQAKQMEASDYVFVNGCQVILTPSRSSSTRNWQKLRRLSQSQSRLKSS